MAIKIVFFDVEGTLLLNKDIHRPGGLHGASVWARIFEDLGPNALDDDNVGLRRFDAKEITYIEWCEHSITAFTKHGLTRERFTELIDEPPFRPGTKETIAELHRRGIRTALISGGFIEQARRVQRELRVNHASAAVELFWDESGHVEHANVLPSDYEAKIDFVELLRRECGITKAECAFVGNGNNDTHIAQHVGISFAVPDAHPNLKAVASHTLTDFQDLLRHLS